MRQDKYAWLGELWYTIEPTKNWTRDTLLTCFWYISIWYFFTTVHTHFIQLRYDFLSSIIIWYIFECIKVYLIHLLSVSKLNQNKVSNFDRFKSVSKFNQGIYCRSIRSWCAVCSTNIFGLINWNRHMIYVNMCTTLRSEGNINYVLDKHANLKYCFCWLCSSIISIIQSLSIWPTFYMFTVHYFIPNWYFSVVN